MHFTLWQNNKTTEGGHTDLAWTDFVSWVASPVVAADKSALEGWSPVRFRDNRRAAKHVEAVSCIVLDDDTSGLPIDQVAALYPGVAGLVHTTHSHTIGAPKHRVALQCSRDMTTDEHARVWTYCASMAAKRGQPLDTATRDASRLWYVPAHAPEAAYEWRELPGQPLDVDAILAAAPAPVEPPATVTAPREPVPASGDGARKAAAASLAAVWPPHTKRHPAKLALAGALRSDGWSKDEAREFLQALYDVVGSEGDTDVEALNSTYSKPKGSALTGWTRLGEHVDPAVVQSARDLLGGAKTIRALLAEVAPAPEPNAAGLIEVEGLRFKLGGLDAPLPAIPYQVGTFIARGEVVMLAAQGNSLKTWLAFSLAHALASGQMWLGQFPTIRGRVGILDFESGDYEVARRLKLLGVKDSDVGDRLLRCSYPDLDLTRRESWAKLAKLRLDLLAWDSFAASTQGIDENDKRAADMLQLAGEFANATECTVVVIHHNRKGSGGDEREQVRGSTAIYAACDRVYKFSAPEKKDGGIVLTDMSTSKDGPGRRPPVVRVELSDQGLRFVECVTKPDEEKPPSTNREIVIANLKGNPAGVPKQDLLNVLHGQTKVRNEALSQLVLTGVVRQYRQGKQLFVMLSPNLDH